MSITTWRFPWKLYKYWSKFLEFHSVPCAPFLTVLFKCINCNMASLFQFPGPYYGLSGLTEDSPTALSCVCLNLISIKWQAASQIMTKKNGCTPPPSSASVPPSIHPSIYLSVYPCSLPLLSALMGAGVLGGGRQTNSQEWLNECLINERKKR